MLRILDEATEPVRIGEVTERIGDRECESPTADDLRAVYLALYHNHVPRFEEADVVTYDRDDGTIRPARNFDGLLRVLIDVDERDVTWSDR